MLSSRPSRPFALFFACLLLYLLGGLILCGFLFFSIGGRGGSKVDVAVDRLMGIYAEICNSKVALVGFSSISPSLSVSLFFILPLPLPLSVSPILILLSLPSPSFSLCPSPLFCPFSPSLLSPYLALPLSPSPYHPVSRRSVAATCLSLRLHVHEPYFLIMFNWELC